MSELAIRRATKPWYADNQSIRNTSLRSSPAFRPDGYVTSAPNEPLSAPLSENFFLFSRSSGRQWLAPRSLPRIAAFVARQISIVYSSLVRFEKSFDVRRRRKAEMSFPSRSIGAFGLRVLIRRFIGSTNTLHVAQTNLMSAERLRLFWTLLRALCHAVVVLAEFRPGRRMRVQRHTELPIHQTDMHRQKRVTSYEMPSQTPSLARASQVGIRLQVVLNISHCHPVDVISPTDTVLKFLEEGFRRDALLRKGLRSSKTREQHYAPGAVPLHLLPPGSDHEMNNPGRNPGPLSIPFCPFPVSPSRSSTRVPVVWETHTPISNATTPLTKTSTFPFCRKHFDSRPVSAGYAMAWPAYLPCSPSRSEGCCR
ncbi:uncharacterized protein CLUP02_09125 [Colletotrichum lupini]|uniref:Uncharacterized protein n=1 Tax=Colletotrichum lupini TaxID=145971 RepID=A0A9Q8WIA4_9PEZI|nr:uncharacterized protein CLUP02_09125 [Colletotrichum lupini]UQC83630.1 hypothetical protein CLUP02_09125 [Colletotrichum lupini]